MPLSPEEYVDLLARIRPRVLDEPDAAMLRAHTRRLIAEANARDIDAWEAVDSAEAWEAFRDQRIDALRKSLGPMPSAPDPMPVEVASTAEGDGYVIENLAYQCRPGDAVAANLYRPADAAPTHGILIVHSHHRPKTQGELQDMGITWARRGAAVLVPDMVGHGERSQNPFGGRQDYYFRYQLGMQLHTAGLSLIGWMAWDLMRGLDVLSGHAGVPADKLILLGAVAGGGDPAAVVAALDERVACVAPFNFGGPQPETVYPLPADARLAFNYFGSGSFESTRNLLASVPGGFAPWVIVAAAAPRPLNYAHEFAWDAARDPVWARLETIYQWYDARDRLDALHGWGRVTLRPPEASHCTNIGPPHREQLYPFLDRTMGLPVPEAESQDRRDGGLAGLTEDVREKLNIRPIRALAAEHVAALRMTNLDADLPARWAELLGGVEPADFQPHVVHTDHRGDIKCEHVELRVDGDVRLPLLFLHPEQGPAPVVAAVAQQGKAEFQCRRLGEISRLLAGGVAVCLLDVRGTGETDPGDDRSRGSLSTGVSSEELMLGRSMLGRRVVDLRTAIAWLRRRADVDAARVAVWGDSFAEPNDPDYTEIPQAGDSNRDSEVDGPPPRQAEPLGGLLAILAGLFDPQVAAIAARRGLVSFASILQTSFVHLPHDVIVPGILTAGDLPDAVARLAPRPVRIDVPVDARNLSEPTESLRSIYRPATDAYVEADAANALAQDPEDDVADWLLAALR